MIIIKQNKRRQQQQQQQQQADKSTSMTTMSLKYASIVGLVVVLAMLVDLSQVAECQEQLNSNTVAINRQKDSENELSDTIKYLEKLEKLDKYWSEVARPRFGRSKFKQMDGNQRFISFNGQPQQQQQQQQQQQYGSLVDLINAHLAQKYNSNY